MCLVNEPLYLDVHMLPTVFVLGIARQGYVCSEVMAPRVVSKPTVSDTLETSIDKSIQVMI